MTQDPMSGSGGGFWDHVWKTTALLNLLVGVLAVLWFGRRHLVFDGEVHASDLVLIVLAAVTVVLAALALVLGGLAIWGFGEIRRAAVDAARPVALEAARKVAADVAGAVAARGSVESQEILQIEPQSTNMDD